jgi:hypothetical protein
MYFEDLTPYTYSDETAYRDEDGAYVRLGTDNTVNVGWLEGSMPYEEGETPEAFHEKLLEYCYTDYVVNQSKGFHPCDLPDCPLKEDAHNPGEAIAGKPEPIEEEEGERVAMFGSGELRVVGEDVIYAAPTLIYHYVVDHQYMPPREFIDAVVHGPEPGSADYYDRLHTLAGE